MLSARVIFALALWLTVSSTTNAFVSRNMQLELDRVSQDVTTYPYHKDFKTCPISIDIAYLIDGSSSVDQHQFDLQKTVVKVMAYFFGVMRLGTHDGVVVYSNTASTKIRFSDHYNFDSFRDAVKLLTKPVNQGTRVDLALEEAHDNLFMGSGGARVSKDIPKLAVIFTDGESGGQPWDIAVKPLEDKNVIVFAVGIGPKANLTQLSLLTLREDLVFIVKDYIALYLKIGSIARKICQHVQFRGPTGPAGPQGPDGALGPKGQRGPAGLPGGRGNMGALGPKGFQGDKGPVGDNGTPGILGANGPQGPQGTKGPKGQSGGKGATGPRGPGGDPGNDGDSGLRGPKGYSGPTGLKGDAGDNGIPGIPGTNGIPGPKGSTGAPGDRGDSGRPGLDGSNGPRGPKGQPGANGANGGQGSSGAPGPKGDRGLRGAKGVPGGPGAPGAPGPNGDNGVNGDPGDNGPRGPRGTTGFPGPKGFKGSTGDNGLDGTSGSRGPKGTAGATGNDSAQAIVCVYKESPKGQNYMSCEDLTTTATDCGCSRGCGEWSISNDGQKCSCKCNSYVPSTYHKVGVNCCKLQ